MRARGPTRALAFCPAAMLGSMDRAPGGFIRLTAVSGAGEAPVWVNPAHLAALSAAGGGTKLRLVGAGDLVVRESPPEILALLEPAPAKARQRRRANAGSAVRESNGR